MTEESNVEMAWDAKHYIRDTEHDQILISSQGCRRWGRRPQTDREVAPDSSLAQVSDRGQVKSCDITARRAFQNFPWFGNSL